MARDVSVCSGRVSHGRAPGSGMRVVGGGGRRSMAGPALGFGPGWRWVQSTVPLFAVWCSVNSLLSTDPRSAGTRPPTGSRPPGTPPEGLDASRHRPGRSWAVRSPLGALRPGSQTLGPVLTVLANFPREAFAFQAQGLSVVECCDSQAAASHSFFSKKTSVAGTFLTPCPPSPTYPPPGPPPFGKIHGSLAAFPRHLGAAGQLLLPLRQTLSRASISAPRPELRWGHCLPSRGHITTPSRGGGR